MCPVCKEAVPQAEVPEHHEKMHKMAPCKKCGESVCGTDLEDHIRDSCAYTMQTCRYCSLELRRSEVPTHEKYCGARTEQCPECREWVMLKYTQLHLDSNHGFLRLDDDPAPVKKETKVNNPIKVIKSENGVGNPASNDEGRAILNQIRESIPEHGRVTSSRVLRDSQIKGVNEFDGAHASSSGAVPKPKRTNSQPQINTSVTNVNKINKNISRGAIKKRPAPNPPPKPTRDLPLYSAMKRMQDEERKRQEQNAYNLAAGLPPVLTPAEKVEKLRKMDALRNRETVDDQCYKKRLNGRVWMSPDVDVGHVLSGSEIMRNIVPMSGEDFERRFSSMRLEGGENDESNGGGMKNGRGEDRFNQIKSSLRELRRGLNEITTPYNANSSADANQNQVSPADDEESVQLPCEFCSVLVPLVDLVQHQTGCRPDLTQLRVQLEDKEVKQEDPPEARGPVIPCEFCAESLPVYLIEEHQERCGRETNLLYPD
ncbi:uncharacterized protein LOC126967772 isoform X2 [Leptidea sinapis]|nr:uncharacterized protein LOC126967772 isoform X2 [Leptidea sinapis]XP_050668412.1 uncharacterized protein LOC126967772 isoform X2 [Leptidea sinapis]